MSQMTEEKPKTGTPGSLRAARQERRAEWMLASLSSFILLLIAGMVIFVFIEGWPSFSHNGLWWFGWGGNVDQQMNDIFNSPADPSGYVYKIRTWPLLYATLLTTGLSVLFGTFVSVFGAVFLVDFGPGGAKRAIAPVVRALAAVPSVIYGLIGILVLVPFVGDHLISEERKTSVIYVVQLSGTGLLVAVTILTLMITPIMLSIVADSLRAVPVEWREGAIALGANRWRVMWTISIRAARPAIIAAAVIASARAIGEGIMLSMVSGSIGFAPNPQDGVTFIFEPLRPYAATIVDNAEGLSVKPFGQTIYAMASVLLITSLALSVAGSLAKRPLKRYGVRL
jgi:ABC-type phosphate transport system permease subunit